MPYFRIFDGDRSAHEYKIEKKKVVIGRNTSLTDIVLEHATVSRIHAMVTLVEGRFVLEDAHSRAGTFINGTRIHRPAFLRHADTVQAGACILEFRTDDAELKQQMDSAVGMNRAMLMAFRPLPEAIRVRYRSLGLRPEDVFAPGDTILVGRGGILVPDADPLPVASCLELELTSPSGKASTFPGEVLALVPGSPNSMCVKIHGPDEIAFQQAMMNCRRGSWKLIQKGLVIQAPPADPGT